MIAREIQPGGEALKIVLCALGASTFLMWASARAANTTCETAKEITALPFSASAAMRSLSAYPHTYGDPPCVNQVYGVRSTAGSQAIWKLGPSVAAGGRKIRLDTKGSNLRTIVAVYTNASGVCVGGTPLVCSDSGSLQNTSLTFIADGLTTYYIMGELPGGLGKFILSVDGP
jgi:hypothetical protein